MSGGSDARTEHRSPPASAAALSRLRGRRLSRPLWRRVRASRAPPRREIASSAVQAFRGTGLVVEPTPSRLAERRVGRARGDAGRARAASASAVLDRRLASFARRARRHAPRARRSIALRPTSSARARAVVAAAAPLRRRLASAPHRSRSRPRPAPPPPRAFTADARRRITRRSDVARRDRAVAAWRARRALGAAARALDVGARRSRARGRTGRALPSSDDMRGDGRLAAAPSTRRRGRSRRTEGRANAFARRRAATRRRRARTPSWRRRLGVDVGGGRGRSMTASGSRRGRRYVLPRGAAGSGRRAGFRVGGGGRGGSPSRSTARVTSSRATHSPRAATAGGRVEPSALMSVVGRVSEASRATTLQRSRASVGSKAAAAAASAAALAPSRALGDRGRERAGGALLGDVPPAAGAPAGPLRADGEARRSSSPLGVPSTRTPRSAVCARGAAGRLGRIVARSRASRRPRHLVAGATSCGGSRHAPVSNDPEAVVASTDWRNPSSPACAAASSDTRLAALRARAASSGGRLTSARRCHALAPRVGAEPAAASAPRARAPAPRRDVAPRRARRRR